MNEKPVLVIGGGIAGIRAAMDLADQGIDVHIIEKKSSLGGRMVQLARTFPLDECSTCLLCHKGLSIQDRSRLSYHGELSGIERMPNIKVHTLSELVDFSGEPGHYTATIHKTPRYIDEEKCISCGLCARKCPVEVEGEFDLGSRKRKAAYLLFPQAIPQQYCIDEKNCLHFTEGCEICKEACPADAVDYDVKAEKVTLDVGAVILATGLDPYDPTPLNQYGYGLYRNVITALEHERMLSVKEVEGEALKRPSDGKTVRKIAYILCVGSRNVRQNSHCSSICCMASVEEAMLATTLNPGLTAYIFHTGFRAIGKEFEKCRARGEREFKLNYIRSRVTKITEDGKGNPIVWYEDTESREIKQMPVDLVVLATSYLPSTGTRKVAELLGIETGKHGFVATDDMFAMDSSRPGIYACGYCRGPADIPESVAQASGAAARAAEFLFSAVKK
jgi:heterodisulfide reductase subunit A